MFFRYEYERFVSWLFELAGFFERDLEYSSMNLIFQKDDC